MPMIRTTSRLALLLGTLLVLALPATAQAQRHFPGDEDLELMLRYLVEDRETPGIVLGILEADGSKRILWYGESGPDALPLGPKSVFEMGSITKVFTGIILSDMVDQGEVSLSDPVSMHLPAGVTVPSRNGREVTLLDLATHRSSLPRMPDNLAQDGSEFYPAYTIPDLYDFLSAHELRRDIGSEYEYSNVAVALLGHVLEQVAGVPYEELLRQRILDPLGMGMTSTRVAGELRRWMTQGHERPGTLAPYRNWPNLPAMGALRSNAEDMLTFLEANVGEPGSRLERAMRASHEVQAPVNDQADIGLNWQVGKLGDRRIITHGGGTAGYSTRIAFDPELRVGVVLLTNTRGFGDDIGMDFLRRGPPLDLGDVEVPTTLLREYVGQYEAAPGQRIFVRLEDEGWLTMQAPSNVRFRMYAESDTSFYVRRTPWTFAFQRDEEGRVTGLVADLEGTERQAARVSAETPDPRIVAGNPDIRDLPLAAPEMARYEGTYTLDMGSRSLDVRVFIEAGVLMAQPSGQGSSQLLHQGDHEFVTAVDTGIRLVFTLDDGRAEELTLHQGGQRASGARKRSAPEP